jgi:hypothetical protein
VTSARLCFYCYHGVFAGRGESEAIQANLSPGTRYGKVFAAADLPAQRLQELAQRLRCIIGSMAPISVLPQLPWRNSGSESDRI